MHFCTIRLAMGQRGTGESGNRGIGEQGNRWSSITAWELETVFIRGLISNYQISQGIGEQKNRGKEGPGELVYVAIIERAV